ncbi:replication termination factor 2 [Musca vetustissima]|uniref:replication termination factor 2 n=1 Tax=Musca vetustissima TaxID=27455 RepID=UPI002AB72DE7|nr:replication termination factor 2 [Musca vetustissima]
MGCDGGTIPRRDELVRLKKKPEQKDKDSEREFRWRHCAITQQRLQEPIVMCGLGRLYSKQNVIERLLEKETMPDVAKHIKNLKDIKQLNLTPNPAYTETEKTEGLLDTSHAPYICKLTGLEMSGKFRFVGMWSCGCVMSERALKEIKGSSAGACPVCQQPFGVEDVIVLNGNDDDMELMQAKIEMRLAKKKASKKEKKENKEKVTGTETAAVKEENKDDVPSTSKTASSTNGTNGVKAATNGVKSKLVANPKRLGAASEAMQDPELKRLKTDYSVAKDPKASDVFKSLFTSHKSEKEQNRAHWVTYNPFYN